MWCGVVWCEIPTAEIPAVVEITTAESVVRCVVRCGVWWRAAAVRGGVRFPLVSETWQGCKEGARGPKRGKEGARGQKNTQEGQ